MFSSTTLIASFLLLGNAFAFPHFPHFPVKRDPATCNQDNLLRCFVNTKSTAAASAFCAALTPLTVTAATVTASAAVTTTTTVVASTETDGVTVLVTSTIVVPVVASTAIVNVKKRSVNPPLCYTNGGTTYAPARLTSACSCIGVPASTVSGYTYTVSTSTATIVSVVPITTTTSVSTTSTVLTTNTAYLTSTVTTTTTLPTPSVCGAPSSSNLVSNPSFECGTLSPWIKSTTDGVYAAIIENGIYSAGSASLFTYTQLIKDEGFAPGQVSQILTTIPGKTYSVSFDMHMDGFGCYWTVSAAGVVIATNEINGVFTQTGWQSYSGTFAAAAATSELVIKFRSGTWGYADWMWDNFVVAPVELS